MPPLTAESSNTVFFNKINSIFSDSNPLKGAASQLAAVLNINEKTINIVITARGHNTELSQLNQLGSHPVNIAM